MLAPQLSPLALPVDNLRTRSALSDEEAAALVVLPFRQVSAGAGTYLLREGDVAKNCFVLLSGMACRHKVTRGGSRQILGIDLAGDFVGLDQSLLDVADYSVQILSPADVGFVPYPAVFDLIVEFPNIGKALWRDTFVGAAIDREWIVNVGTRSAHQRVAHLICELAVRGEATTSSDGGTIDWPMTQEQVGDATGLTPVHVNRTLQSMRGVGLIRTEKHRLTILDWDALQDAGDFNSAYLHRPLPQPAR